MDLSKLLSELHSEVERLNQAIAVVEGLIAKNGKRRGRPPKWMVAKRAEQATPAEAATEAAVEE